MMLSISFSSEPWRTYRSRWWMDRCSFNLLFIGALIGDLSEVMPNVDFQSPFHRSRVFRGLSCRVWFRLSISFSSELPNSYAMIFPTHTFQSPFHRSVVSFRYAIIFSLSSFNLLFIGASMPMKSEFLPNVHFQSPFHRSPAAPPLIIALLKPLSISFSSEPAKPFVA